MLNAQEYVRLKVEINQLRSQLDTYSTKTEVNTELTGIKSRLNTLEETVDGLIHGGSDGNVSYLVDQTLTTQQQSRARNNIDAASVGEVSLVSVDLADLQADFSVLQQQVADLIIGSVGDAVRYGEQELTTAQQTQARANISAASTSDIDTVAQAVSDLSDDIDAQLAAYPTSVQVEASISTAIAENNEDIVAEEYDPLSTYIAGDYCLNESELYWCTDETGMGPFDPTKWIRATLTGRIAGIEGQLALFNGNYVSVEANQGLTSEEKENARTNISAASTLDITSLSGDISDLESDLQTFEQSVQSLIDAGVANSVRYDSAQNLTDGQKTQARSNIGAASSSEVSTIRTSVGDLETQIGILGDNVEDVVAVEGGLRVDYANGSSKNIEIEAGSELDSVDYDANYYLHFYDANGDELYGGPFFIQGGGGGSASGGTATITRITNTPMDCVYQMPALIEYTFAATDSSGDTVGNGTGSWSVGGITVARNISVAQGRNSFDISPYLSAGENNVRLTVSVDTGGETETVVKKTWTVNAVNMRFTWAYNDSQINESDFLDSWTVYGDITKTTHTSIDGDEIDPITTSRSNVTQSVRIPMLEHGAHSVERWLTATIGGSQQSTDVQYHEMIFAEPGDMTPIVAISMQDTEMDQYDTIQIPVVVYDPATLLADATLSVDGTQVGTWDNIDRSLHYWTYTPSVAGEHTLTVTCGAVSKSITVDVNEIELDVEEVSGYSFRFKSSDFAANEAVRNWSSNGVTATFSQNFNWINGGLHTETDDNGNLQQYFCIKAGTQMTINHELFAVDPKANGMTFKMIYKIKNCRNYDAEIAHCYSNVGIRLYAHEAVFNSSGTTVNVPYGEDEYIELEFDVYPAPRQENDGNVRYMMAWMDGVITTCRVYGETDNFVQPIATREGIVIGSADCDVYLYMVKAYPMLEKSSNFDNHISNFIMDAPNASEMAKRYRRNNILDEGGDISYEKLMAQNPDLHVWLYDIPYLTNDKDDKVKNCQFHQFWPAGDLSHELSGTGTMRVQGTSSVKYIKGAANTDIDFTALEDGNGTDLMANGTKDDTYGNNWYVEDPLNPGHAKVFDVVSGEELGPECVAVERDANRNVTKYIKALGYKIKDDSCPITYSNTKVNFASCEQVNNMCNASWYQRYNPYPSLTPHDCMEFNMGVQFIKDSGTVPDAQHFVLFGDDKYHMYSIANMGNSKKNVHVFHDLSNEDEVCIEVNDNDKDQMRMVSDDLSLEDWSGKVYFGMRYPDTKNPSQEIRDAWQALVTWFATNNPNAATGEALAEPETYGVYTFRGHDRGGTQVLRGTTVTKYAGTYTHDTFNRRMAKMLSECEDHMVMDSFVYHFVYLERHTMVDNVSKNNFWSSTDLVHWDLSKAYDMDTSDGNNNQGQLVFDYGLEFDDINPTDQKTVFNGSDSVWFVFVGNLYEACRTMFVNREAAGAWSATAYHNFLLSEQQKVPERCWVQCYWYDYLRTYEEGISGEWMSFLDGGQKTHQRKHYETYEELYDSSKYRGSASTSQNVNLRAYTPSQWGGEVINPSGGQIRRTPSATGALVATVPEGEIVYISEKTNYTWRKVSYQTYEGYMLLSSIDALEPKGELTVTMYNKMYISVDVGTTALDPVKAQRGVPYVISFDEGGLTSNTVISINTAPMIQAISGFEQLYPDTCVFSAAIRLRELTIGSNATGYVNNNLRSLSLDNNVMLERLYVQNQPNANSVLDLSNCPSLVYLDASGSGFTGYEFADGGLLTTAILEAPVSLNMRNLVNLTDQTFDINDYTRLSAIRFENVDGVDSYALVSNSTNLQIARLIGIDWTLPNADPLERMYNLQGYDDAGITISRAVLAGDAFSPTMRNRALTLYGEAWPDLDITYNNIVEQYEVRFLDEDGTPLLDGSGNEYIQYIDRGSSAYDPITAEELDTPIKAADAQYTYTFSGWTNLSGIVLEAKNVTAQYTSTVRTYTVRWFSGPGVMLKSVEVEYGSEALYSNDETDFPVKTDEESVYYYNIFTGWDKSTGFVTENLDVYAVWERSSLPVAGTVELKDMTPAQIYGVSKTMSAPTYWESGDYVDIPVGRDFSFSNVNSEVLGQNLTFDKTNIVDTHKQLFSADAPSFTLAIDYEFLDTASESTLVSCYGTSGAEGFRLFCRNNTPTIMWGDQTATVGNYMKKRGMLVLFHAKGSRSLVIVSNNNTNNANNYYQQNLYTVELTRATDSVTDATLLFGGTTIVNGNIVYPGAGTINWCKVWYGNLGLNALQQLANWPHETWRMKYVDANRYYPSDGSGLPVGATFVSNAPLSVLCDLSPSDNSWDTSDLFTYLNTRVYKALPYAWQQIIRSVNLPVVRFDAPYTPTLRTVPAKVYMPARIDIDSSAAGGDYQYDTEGNTFPFVVDEPDRLYFAGIIIPEDSQLIEASSDPSASSLVYTVKEGDIWRTGRSARAYIYVSAATAAKHHYIGGREKTSSEYVQAADGGLWVLANDTWTRSHFPYQSNPYYYYVSPAGVATAYNYYTYYQAVVPMFSV